ncbi:MAG TPA: TlpA family protein disulfide reductase [Bacteroidetes bacterium]|nr:TlpA family protein disulfide reductase [Bacteroidota bacterium]
MKNNTDVRYSNVLEKLYEKHVVIAKGAIAPEFSYHDIDSVYYSLKDFKGKYVYIDVWATWCVPCLAERSDFERIIDNYSDNNNIIFVGVSIDKDKNKWKRMVLGKKMKGIQLIADNAWKSTITHDYKINSIPRFLLIDKGGKIIDINAPRPSNPLIERTLANLLEK